LTTNESEAALRAKESGLDIPNRKAASMPFNRILDPSDPQSTHELTTRRLKSLAALGSFMARYASCGDTLRPLIAEQAWAEDYAVNQDAIDRLNNRRNELLWFALKEQRTAVDLGVGFVAMRTLQTGLDRDSRATIGERDAVTI
jgi:hypothetical protein